MANYTVTAPLVVLRQQDGSYVHLYEGTPVPDSGDTNHVKQLVDYGMLSAAADEPADGPPARSASKADWEDYARSQGATDADINGVTKDDLVAAYGES